MRRGYEIRPSVLAGTIASFRRRLRLARRLTSRLHIDIMDGRFVSTRSISADQLATINLPTVAEIHLMVQEPSRWIAAVKKTGARQVILPIEIPLAERRRSVRAAKQSGLTIGWAIKMTTPLKRLPVVSWIHVMTGPIGKYGRSMSTVAPQRIQDIKRRLRPKKLSADVGLSPQTIPLVIRAGATGVVVGSYLAKPSSVKQHWAILKAQRRSRNMVY